MELKKKTRASVRLKTVAAIKGNDALMIFGNFEVECAPSTVAGEPNDFLDQP
jgi:hypothetical protein